MNLIPNFAKNLRREQRNLEGKLMSCKNCIHLPVCRAYEKVESIILDRPKGNMLRILMASKVYKAFSEICDYYQKEKERS